METLLKWSLLEKLIWGKKLVPLKDVFKAHHDDIEVFRQDKPGAYKLLKHILESDAKVTKAQAGATEIKLEVDFKLQVGPASAVDQTRDKLKEKFT